MLRIHFTGADIAKTRVLATLGPLAETLLALHVVQRGRSTLFDPWRRAIALRVPAAAREIAPLYSQTDPILDLFTSQAPTTSLEEGIDGLLATPSARVAAELAYVAGLRPIPRWTERIALHQQTGRGHFASAVVAANGAMIRPFWPCIRSVLDTDRAVRSRRILDGGIDDFLRTLHPAVRWSPPVLEIAVRPVGRAAGSVLDHHLAGQGIDFVPAVFCHPRPQFYSPADLSRPALVLYPAVRDLVTAAGLWTGNRTESQALAALLGRTRATVLQAIADRPGINTSELAQTASISLASASEHASTLRQAGLVVNRRDGKASLHLITPTGRALLDGQTRR